MLSHPQSLIDSLGQPQSKNDIMKVLIVVLIAGLFALVSSLTIDKNKGGESKVIASGGQEKRYVKRHSYFNPNPTEKIDKKTGKPKSWGKGDCVIRAFCGVLDLPWEVVYSEICQVGAECHDLPNTDEPIQRYAKEKGLIKRTLRPQTSVSEFAHTHNGVYLVVLKSHAVCVKNNRVYDTGDCGRSKMNTYYEKGGANSDSCEGTSKPRERKKKSEPSAIEKEILEELEKELNVNSEEKDVSAYTYFNPNPESGIDDTTGKPLPFEKCDNVMRAFSGALSIPWDVVYSDLCKIGLEEHDMPDSRKVISRYAKEKGLVRKTLSSPMTLNQFASTHHGVYLVQLSWGLSPQLTFVRDNKIHDIWDYSLERIRTYYEAV